MAAIPSYFQRYLRAIQPTRASRELAMQLHSTLRERLEDDKLFQDWFKGTFLYGSYKRNTAIQPIKDVDICVLLNIDPDDYEPERVINRLRRVLERNKYDAKTALQRRSVRIDMSSTTLDVVPVVQLDGDDDPLLIPDRPLEEWVDTHPKAHLAAATRLNKESGRRYIPLVKITKSWYRFQRSGVVRPKPKGFTLEALVAEYHDATATSYAEAFIRFLENLWEDCGTSLEKGAFPDVPDPGQDDKYLTLTFTKDEAIAFGKVVKASLADAVAALDLNGIATSAQAWQAILGDKFPTTPATTKLTATKATGLDEELGTEEIDAEIEEIDLPVRGLLAAPAPPALVFPDRPVVPRKPAGFA